MLKEDGNLDIRVRDGRYQLQRKLGRGSFGIVYQALDLVTREEVAIKLEDAQSGESQLELEANVYTCKELRGRPGIPQVYWYGHEGEFSVLVFELLGPNVLDLLNYCGGVFSLKTVLMLADQLIPRLEKLHRKCTHRDLKPENILKGRGRKGNDFYITDIGLGEELEESSWRDENWAGNGRLIGTARYASIRAHAGKELSPRDDLESLGYVLVYLLRGSLPWQGLRAGNGESVQDLVGDKKRNTSLQDLCRGLPEQFVSYFEHVAGIPHRGKPDYVYLRRLFQGAFTHQGLEYDHIFDWTELKFLAQLEEKESEEKSCGKVHDEPPSSEFSPALGNSSFK